MKKIKICAYTIALNEEKHVMRWLEGTKDADVRVVVDTGSTDRTVKMLQAAPRVIVHQISVKPFRFDDARNAALALIPADVDVCLSLDMDEIPEKDFKLLMLRLKLKDSDITYLVNNFPDFIKEELKYYKQLDKQ